MAVEGDLPTHGRTRVFFEDATHNAEWSRVGWLASYERLLTLDDGRQFPLTSVEERLGFVYREPDSGSVMTNIMVVLDTDEPDPVGLPDQATVSAAAPFAMMPLIVSIGEGRTDPDDLDFCRQIFMNQAAMLRSIQRHGSLEAAHSAILRDVFRL